MIVSWRGDEFLRAFADGKAKVEKETAERVASRARRRCPSDTGKLKASIDVKKSKFKDGGYSVLAGSKELYYASFVELGARNRKGVGFMRGSAHAEKKRFATEMKEMADRVSK